jgi:DNA-binding phage protein
LKEAVTQPEAGQAAERLAELLDETLGDLKDLQARVGEMGKIAEKAGVSNPWIGKLESTLKTTIREGKDFFTHLEDQWGEK